MLQDILEEYGHLVEAENGAHVGDSEPSISDGAFATYESVPTTPAEILYTPLISPSPEYLDEEDDSSPYALPDASNIFNPSNSTDNSQPQPQFPFSFQPLHQPRSSSNSINHYSTHTHHPLLYAIAERQSCSGAKRQPPASGLVLALAPFQRHCVVTPKEEKKLSPENELELAKKASNAPNARLHRPNAADVQATKEYITELERKAEILQYNLDIKQEARDKILAYWDTYYMTVEKQNAKTYQAHKNKILEEAHSDMKGMKDDLDVVLKEVGQRKAMLSPIRRLHTDGLLYLFQTCILSADEESEDDLSTSPLPKKMMEGRRTSKGWKVFTLMQVCGLWRQLLQGMPWAWRDISLFPPAIGLTERDYIERLHTYCERAGGLPINMTIAPLWIPDMQGRNDPKPNLSPSAIEKLSAMLLLRMMKLIPMQRWKTLRILHASKFPFLKLRELMAQIAQTMIDQKKKDDDKSKDKDANIMAEKDKIRTGLALPKLETLVIADPPADPSSFFNLVVKTSPNLRHLQIVTNSSDRNYTKFLSEYTNFGNKLLTLRTNVTHVQPGRLHLPNSLTALKLNFLPDRAVILPNVKALEVEQHCDLLRLRYFELPNLTHLKCKNFCYSQPGPGVTRVHMPSLISVIITGMLSPGLEVLSAPNLEELYIEQSEGSSKENKWKTIKFLSMGASSRSDVSNNPDDNNNSWASLSATHNIRPAKLTINAPLITDQITSIFQANPQLTHFTATLDKNAKWKRKLRDVLCQIKLKTANRATVAKDGAGVGDKGSDSGEPGCSSGNTRSKNPTNEDEYEERGDIGTTTPSETSRTTPKPDPDGELELCPLLEALTFWLDFGGTNETKGIPKVRRNAEEVYELDTWRSVTSSILQIRRRFGAPLTITCKWNDGKVMTFHGKEGFSHDGDEENKGQNRRVGMAPTAGAGGAGMAETGQNSESDSNSD